jgi:hypothetical protein
VLVQVLARAGGTAVREHDACNAPNHAVRDFFRSERSKRVARERRAARERADEQLCDARVEGKVLRVDAEEVSLGGRLANLLPAHGSGVRALHREEVHTLMLCTGTVLQRHATSQLRQSWRGSGGQAIR